MDATGPSNRSGFIDSFLLSWDRSSGKALVLANLTPVIGLLFLDWTVFTLVFLYWFENVVIGVFQVFRMLLVGAGSPKEAEGALRPERPLLETTPSLDGRWLPVVKAGAILFFCFHYGLFTAVHGLFVMTLFGGGINGIARSAHFHCPPNVGFAIIALTVSHGVSFIKDYWLGGEYQAALIPQLMAEPYGRVVVLHVFIIMSGVLFLALQLSPHLLVFLVGAKILWDCRHDVRRRTEIEAPAPAAPATAA